MKIGFSTVLVDGLGVAAQRRPTVAEADSVFAWARTAGFDSVELSDRWLPISDPAAWLWAADRARMQDLSICSLSMFRRMPFGPSEHAHDDIVALRFAAEMAANFPGAVVSVAIASSPDVAQSRVPEDDHQQLLALVGQMADTAARGGASIALELHDDGPFDSAEYLQDAVRELTAHKVGCNPDLGNCLRRDELWSWRDALKALAPTATLWHVKNYRGGVNVPLDDGEIDYASAWQIMKDADFSGVVVPETRFGAEPRLVAARAADYLRRLDYANTERAPRDA